MQNNNERDGFSYTYSAKEQAEIKRIREKYTGKTEREGRLERLRKLDASVNSTAQATAIIFGVIGALVLGFGMSLCMTDLGDMIGLDGNAPMAVGIIIGVIGGVLASLAYPIYNCIVKIRRRRIAPEILLLTEELMK